MKKNRCFLALPALLLPIACSDDDGGAQGTENGDGGASADSGPSAGGSAGMSTGGSGGMSGGGSGGASGSSTDGGAVTRTSDSCGSIPILGDYSSSIPAECATCIETSCCEQATACGDNAGCTAYRECAASCGLFDYQCRNECAFANNTGGLNGPFNQCRSVSCAACTDLRCVDEPFPAPSQATYSAELFIFNLATSTGVASVIVKVCDRADVDCATPLDEQTTDAGGNVTVTLPSAPKGTTAYLEITGAGITPQLTFLGNREPETSLSAGLLVLDAATSAAYLQLSGGTLPPDGGTYALGSLGIQGYSCGGSSLAGVTFESSNAGPNASTAYMSGGVPSTTATETNGSGQGAIVDHAPGPTTVSMIGSSGTTLGSMEVLVREGFFTTVTIPVGP